MPGEVCLSHFHRWMNHRGDIRSLCPDIVPDIAPNEGSGGHRPVASRYQYLGDQYLGDQCQTSDISQ